GPITAPAMAVCGSLTIRLETALPPSAGMPREVSRGHLSPYSESMRKQQAIIALREQCDAVKALGVTSLYLFGSTVHDAAGTASDLDIFVDYDRDSRFSLIELVGIQQLLEQRLGVRVDITTRDSLDPLLRDRIEASAERIF